MGGVRAQMGGSRGLLCACMTRERIRAQVWHRKQLRKSLPMADGSRCKPVSPVTTGLNCHWRVPACYGCRAIQPSDSACSTRSRTPLQILSTRPVLQCCCPLHIHVPLLQRGRARPCARLAAAAVSNASRCVRPRAATPSRPTSEGTCWCSLWVSIISVAAAGVAGRAWPG